MVRKSKKVIEKTEEKENVNEIQDEDLEMENSIENEEIIDDIPPLNGFVETLSITPLNDKVEEIEVVDKNDIKSVLKQKKKMSEKQRTHVESLKQRRIDKEKEKKQSDKKMKELLSLGLNIDEILDNARKLKVKREYENLYGNKKRKKIVKKQVDYEIPSESDEETRDETTT